MADTLNKIQIYQSVEHYDMIWILSFIVYIHCIEVYNVPSTHSTHLRCGCPYRLQIEPQYYTHTPGGPLTPTYINQYSIYVYACVVAVLHSEPVSLLYISIKIAVWRQPWCAKISASETQIKKEWKNCIYRIWFYRYFIHKPVTETHERLRDLHLTHEWHDSHTSSENSLISLCRATYS